jgi:carboxymethylenebutenolidase
MCFDFDARPPELPADLALPPLAGGAGAELLTLQSADGTSFSAALAQAPQARGPGVIVLPDVRGLYRFYVELAERFAQAGHDAVAIDYFGRTAGLAPRDEEFEYMSHVVQTRTEQIQTDAAAAREALAQRTDARAFVAVGFCFGGTQAFMATTNPQLGLEGVVGFYGGLVARRPGAPTVLEHLDEMRGPILALFGGADQSIAPEQVAAFDRGLDQAGVEHEVVSYEGAPHSFFDRSFAEHAEACDDAWRRVLRFLDQVGAGAR